ncbi:MAG: hypothetical protein OXD30_02535 [Bryobacterales bacterium]|nr:hypothetical protein [Bryobacterales bacterium]
MSTETKWLVGIALALAGLILQQSASLRADIRDINGRLESLDSRLRAVEQMQAQHGLLLQLLAQRVLGMDAGLPQPAVSGAPPVDPGPGDPA